MNLVNINQQTGKWINIFEFCIYPFVCIIFMMVLFFLWFSCFYDDYMILIILNILCKYYASYYSNIYILHFVPFWNKTFPDRQSIQHSSCWFLSIGRKIFWSNVPKYIQSLLPHCRQIQWGVFINSWWHQYGDRPIQ